MPDEKQSAPDPREIFPAMDAWRQCRNPKCRKWFRPRSKFHPHQLYCGEEACNRSRHCQRQWKHAHPDLYEKVTRAHGRQPVSGAEAAVVNCRILWLLAGLLAMVLGLDGTPALEEALERSVAAGCRLCGRSHGLSILTRLMSAGG